MKQSLLNLLTLLSVIFFSCTANDKTKTDESTTDKSYWPKTSRAKKIDTSLVITKISEENLEIFEPLQRSDFVVFGPTFKDAELGRSFNSATGNIQGNLIDYNFKPEEITTRNLGFVNYYFERVTSFQDLVQKFNLDVSASVKYFSFKGNARYEQSKSLQVTKYHEYIAARIYVEDREEALKSVLMKPEAVTLAKQDKKKFVSKYGDQVITSRIVGGDLIVLIEIQSESSQEKSANKVHVDAAMSAWGATASASVDMKNSLEEVKKTSKYKIKLIQNGILADTSTAYSQVSSIQTLIDKFPQLVHEQGRVLEYKRSSIFGMVQNLPANIQPTDFVAILNQSFKLKTLENNLNVVLNTLPDLEYILLHSAGFTQGSLDTAKKYYNRNFQAMRIYEHNWKICATVPELCEQCLKFKVQPQTFSATEATRTKTPEKIEYILGISSEFQPLTEIPASNSAILAVDGQVQYNHIGTLECRSPQRTPIDFNGPGLDDPFRLAGKLMPFLEFQLFEIVGGKEIPFQSSFPYKGHSIDIPKNSRDLILKYRMNLEWVYVDKGEVILANRSVDDKQLHINSDIRTCSGQLKAIVVQ